MAEEVRQGPPEDPAREWLGEIGNRFVEATDPVESKDDIRKTREGYKIETTGGETLRFSEEEVESISVVEEE